MILRNNKERAQVARLYFAVEGFLNSSIANKNKITKSKVEYTNSGLVVCFKMNSSLDSCCDDCGAKISEARAVLLEGDGVVSDKFSGY